MTPENARANAAEEVKRGEEALSSARHLLTGGFFKDAVSRAYYAAYHHARALLFLKGLEAKTHQGLIQLLGLHFVKTGILSQSEADLLPRLETARELSDYQATTEFSRADAERKIQEAEEFMAACVEILKEQGVEISPRARRDSKPRSKNKR